MLSSNKQIVCLSSHYWNDSWFRKQHFMTRFKKEGYKIAYVEPSFSILRRAEISIKEYANNKYFSSIVEKINENIFIIRPPRYIPFRSISYLSRLNFLYLSLHINFILKRLGFKDYILWIYPPQFANSINAFNYKKLVFDISDDIAAYNYSDKSKYEYVKDCMGFLAKKSDLVLVTASTLFDEFKNISSNIHLVPNGYDSTLFTRENVFSALLDMKEVRAPIIGFVGTIFSHLDFKLLNYIVQHNQDKSFVFVGNCELNAHKNWLSVVENYKNVFWLGKKKREEIPNYIDKFDVCINPFKVDLVSRSVSPLKVFEYLAMNKPVVSVRMESLEKEKIAPLIYFASSYQDFSEKLNVALDEKNDYEKKLKHEKINAYSWDHLFRKVFQLVINL